MRTFSKKKKLPRLLTLCGAVAVSALLGGCGQSGVPAESFGSVGLLYQRYRFVSGRSGGGFFSFITSGLFHVS